MSFEIRKFSSDVELVETAAKEWVALTLKSPRHLVALSGGRIAKTFYAAVVKQGSKLSNVDFFWADERCVGPAHPDSNFLLASEGLFKPLGIEATRIHRLRGELAQPSAVKAANEEIGFAAKNGDGFPVLDLVILGVGEDGHTASLFPNATEEIINCRDAFLSVDNSPKPPPERLSMSFGTIAAAKEVWVLTSGEGKIEALRESVKPNGKTPLGRVLQMRKMTKIFTDVEI